MSILIINLSRKNVLVVQFNNMFFKVVEYFDYSLEEIQKEDL